MHGCNWPDIPGIQRTIHSHSLLLPHILLDALLDDVELGSIDDLYDRFEAQVRREVNLHCERVRATRSDWDHHSPGLLRVDDCFLDGPIIRGRSWLVGGVKYPTLICAIAGIASAADSMAALDALVFGSEEISLAAFKQALLADFDGVEVLRKRCLYAPKFGQDDDRADRHAVRLLECVLHAIDCASYSPRQDDAVVVFRCLETDMQHIPLGAMLDATPDGRHAGQPISENTSPSPGACSHGLTSMLRSVAKLPLHGINSGALNARLQPRLFAGDAGLDRLATLLRTYFDLGGLQVQLSLADVQELRDAQLHPERHRDLMVRITGYSAAFVDMARPAQDEIIRREEMGG
jgi:formate C-acetyltransferase